MSESPSSPPPVASGDGKKNYKKIIVAVHGIGKQSRNSTIRSVTLMAAENLPGAPGVVSSSYPLGYFYSSGVGAAANVSPFDEIPDNDETLKGIGFSEVFWADIPQGVVAESRTMEETKEWARTVVARAQRLYERHYQSPPGRRNSREPQDGAPAPKSARKKLVEPDFGLAAEVLDEIIDTVYVLENLSWIAEKAGVMTFDVKEVMEEYLGDVQLVAEFPYFRDKIVSRFHRAMEAIHDEYPHAEIHVVAHSEGSVVAFLGILNALFGRKINPAKRSNCKLGKGAPTEDSSAPPLRWLSQVKGFMTIGSPIDKHFLLWPKLFAGFNLEDSTKQMERGGLVVDQIKWRNYYDLADPVGHKLDTIRAWLEQGGSPLDSLAPAKCCVPPPPSIFPLWKKQSPSVSTAQSRYQNRACKLFDFKDPDDFRGTHHDIGFTRYLLPGKAHNDYWEDVDLFDHFLNDVVNPQDVGPDGKKIEKVDRPRTSRCTGIISALLPFLLSGIFLCAATFILLRGVLSYYVPPINSTDHYMRIMLTGYTSAADHYTSRYILVEFGAWALMLAGTTIGARVHRLGGRRWIWWPIAIVTFIPGAFLVDGEMILSILAIEGDAKQWKPVLAGALVLLCLVVMTLSDYLGRVHLNGRRKKRKDVPGRTSARQSDPRERRLRWLLKGARPLVLLGSTATLILAFLPSLGEVRLNRENLGLAISEKYIYRQKVEGIFGDGHGPEPSKAEGDIIIKSLTYSKINRKGPLKTIEKAGTKALDILKKVSEEMTNRIKETVPSQSAQTSDNGVPPHGGEYNTKEADAIRDELGAMIAAVEKYRGPGSLIPTNAAIIEEAKMKAATKLHSDFTNITKALDVIPPLWPMLLSWLAFCYLWWLSILVFDLSYVWHRYVRKGDLINCLMAWKFPKEPGD